MKIIKFFAKAVIAVAGVFALSMAGAFGYGMYLGFQQVGAYDEQVSMLEAFDAEYGHCPTIESEAEFNAKPECQTICDSFFQCRNDFLMGIERVEREFGALLGDDDVYTYEEYEDRFGPLDLAEISTSPGSSPKPEIN